MRVMHHLHSLIALYSCQGVASAIYSSSNVHAARIFQPLICELKSSHNASEQIGSRDGLVVSSPASLTAEGPSGELTRTQDSEDGTSSTTSATWEVRSSAGKGLGVFATVPIRAGDRIMVEEPLFTIVPPDFRPGMGYQLSEMAASLDATVASLPDSRRGEFYACHQHRLPGEGEADRNMVIFRSNAYTLTDGTIAMFPKVARINHSCRPNAANIWSAASNMRIIWAARDIQPGEEVTVTYAPLLKKSEERQRRLAPYGFRCTCEACHDHEQTDPLRLKMGRILHELEDRLARSTSSVANKKLLPKAVELTRMAEAEHMMDYLPNAYHLAAELALRLGDKAAAAEWSRKALRLHEYADQKSHASQNEHEYLRQIGFD